VIPRLITAADARFVSAGVLSLSRIQSIQISKTKRHSARQQQMLLSLVA